MLRIRIRELAYQHLRYGYRRIYILLKREGWKVNHKTVQMVYLEEGLKLRKRKRELCEANNCYLFEYAKGWSLDRLLGEIESVIKSTPS